MSKTYKIKPGYIHRENISLFDDSHNSDQWQYEVYQLAYTIAKIIPKKPVLDIGCGSGYKLINIFNDFDTLGVELKFSYDILVEKYPNKKWELKTPIPPNDTFGIVILSDVIEHIIDPDDMISYINLINFDYLIISTPNRDDTRLSQDGPPNNESHVREWSFNEFHQYLSQYFNIVNHFVINKEQKTQCAICTKKENNIFL